MAAAAIIPVSTISINTSAYELEEIVVTATKRETNIQDIPVAVSALGGDEIHKLGLTDVQSLQGQIPNVRIESPTGRGAPRFNIRGLGTTNFNTNTSSAVGSYVDEVYMSNMNLQGFPLMDLERVEVLRGPQGTLWGKNTTGGAVHFITKKPSYEEQDGYASVTYGRHNQLDFEGAMGIPISDNVAVRGAVTYLSRDGWIDNNAKDIVADPSTVKAADELGAFEDTAARFQVLIRISEDAELLLSTRARKVNGDSQVWHFNGVDPTFGYPGGDDHDEVNIDSDIPQEIEQFGFSATLTWEIGGISLTSITSYEEGESAYAVDDDASPYATETSYFQIPDVNQISQEIRLSSEIGDSMQWTAGVHFFKEELESSTSYVDYAGGYYGAFGDSAQNTSFVQNDESAAIFGQLDYDINDLWSMSIGLRWTQQKKDIELSDIGYLPHLAGDEADPSQSLFGVIWAYQYDSMGNPLFVIEKDETWEEPTGEISITYRPSKDMTLFGKISRGFRAGGFNGGANFGAEVGTVDSEKLLAYELGAKTTWLEGRVKLNGSLFYYDYTDMHVFDVKSSSTSAGALNELQNAKGGELYGAEVEVEALLAENLLFKGGLGYSHTELDDLFTGDTRTSPAIPYDAEGNQFQASPELTANVLLRYFINLPNGQAYIQSDWKYTDEVYLGLVQSDPNKYEGDYWMGNIRMGYESDAGEWDIAAWVKNLTDEAVKTDTFGPFAGGIYPAAMNEHRTYGISATRHF